MAKNLLQNSCDLVPVTPVVATDQLATPFGMVLLQKKTPVSGVVVDFINLAQYPYQNYKIIISNLITTAAGQVVKLLASTNNGGAFLTTGGNGEYTCLTGAAVGTGGTTTNGVLLLTSYAGNSTIINGSIDIYGVNTTRVAAICNYSPQDGVIATFQTVFGSGFISAGAVVNALEYQTGGFTISSGTLSLYGYS